MKERMKKQQRTNHLFSFYTIWTAGKAKKKLGVHLQQGDVISLLFAQRDTQLHRQQRDLISLLLFFQNKESRLKWGRGERGVRGERKGGATQEKGEGNIMVEAERKETLHGEEKKKE
jgi:hypothetical protein